VNCLASYEGAKPAQIHPKKWRTPDLIGFNSDAIQNCDILSTPK